MYIPMFNLILPLSIYIQVAKNKVIRDDDDDVARYDDNVARMDDSDDDNRDPDEPRKMKVVL